MQPTPLAKEFISSSVELQYVCIYKGQYILEIGLWEGDSESVETWESFRDLDISIQELIETGAVFCGNLQHQFDRSLDRSVQRAMQMEGFVPYPDPWEKWRSIAEDFNDLGVFFDTLQERVYSTKVSH